MTTYPSNTDWVGNGWHAQPTPDTVYTLYKSTAGTAVLFRDRNNEYHGLFIWNTGVPTFQPNTNWRPSYDPHIGGVDENVYRLAESFRTYLDAAVEKE